MRILRALARHVVLGVIAMLETSGAAAECVPPPVAEQVKLGNEAADALEEAERSSGHPRADKAKHAEAIFRRLACSDECDPGMLNLLVASLRLQRRHAAARSVYEDFFAGCRPPTPPGAQYREAQVRFDELRRLPTLEIAIVPATATVTVNGDSWAEMRDQAHATPLEPGDYQVVATLNGYRTATHNVKLSEGGGPARVDIALVLDDQGGGGGGGGGSVRRTLAYVALAGTGVALATGAGLLIVRNDKVKKYNANQSCLGENEPNPTPGCASQLDKATDLSTATTAVFLGAGLLGAASGLLFAWTPADPPRAAVSIRCRPLGLQAVGCRGQF